LLIEGLVRARLFRFLSSDFIKLEFVTVKDVYWNKKTTADGSSAELRELSCGLGDLARWDAVA
jgi:hypothetical protein